MGSVFSHNAGDCCMYNYKYVTLVNIVLRAITCPLIFHSMDGAIELVATDHKKMPTVINCKNISKSRMNPHKHKYTYNNS